VNNFLDSSLERRWNATSWDNSIFKIYNRDVNNVLLNILFQGWDGSNFINVSKQSFSYNSNGDITEKLLQVWDSLGWLNRTRYEYLYDINYQNTESFLYDWDGSSWNLFSTFINYFDINNFPSDQTTTGVLVVDSMHIFYSIITGIEYPDLSNNLIVYPNPASDYLNIELNYSASGPYKTELFNIEGRMVLEKKIFANSISKTETLNLKNLNAGIYFLKISFENKYFIKKVIKDF
jgi:hypothetical protein